MTSGERAVNLVTSTETSCTGTPPAEAAAAEGSLIDSDILPILRMCFLSSLFSFVLAQSRSDRDKYGASVYETVDELNKEQKEY